MTPSAVDRTEGRARGVTVVGVLAHAPDEWEAIPAWIASLTPEEAGAAGVAALVERIDADQDAGRPIPTRVLYLALAALRDRFRGGDAGCTDVSRRRGRRSEALLSAQDEANRAANARWRREHLSRAQIAVLRSLAAAPGSALDRRALADASPAGARVVRTVAALERFGLVTADGGRVTLTDAGAARADAGGGAAR